MSIHIVMDCETTGLLEPESAPLEAQPYITEFFAYRLEDYEIVDEFEQMFSVPFPLDPKITRITGITDADLADKPAFVERLPALQQFFLGAERVVAHNVSFDVGCLKYALRRAAAEEHFPWPPEHYCTVERSMHLRGQPLSLGKLYKQLFEEEMKSAHRARVDVDALLQCYWALEDVA